MNTEQLRAEFEAWWESTPILKENKRTIAEKAYQAGRAALQSQAPNAGWKEATIAWEVCASIHRQYCKGKDPLFKTRQADFVEHAADARKHLSDVDAPQSQDREDAEWMACESRRPWVTNSLKHHIKELRAAEKRSRNAFNKDYMSEPARYFADACGEAAAVIEAKLDAIDHARRVEGGVE